MLVLHCVDRAEFSSMERYWDDCFSVCWGVAVLVLEVLSRGVVGWISCYSII